MINQIQSLADYVTVSKFCKYLPELKRRETWEECVNRSKQFWYDRFDDPEIRKYIDYAFLAYQDKLVLGSNRCLQFAGEALKRNNCRAYNCWFSCCDRSRFFQECIYILLSGGGTGYSVQDRHINKLPKIKLPNKEITKTFVIPDSIEGWADAVGVLLSSYFDKDQPFPDFAGVTVHFDYSLIRPEGSEFSHGIGKAPGYKPLEFGLEQVRSLLNNRCKTLEKLRSIDIYDIICHLSDIVLSGGIRRSSTICLFDIDDELMINAKTGNWTQENPQRARSNNSAVAIKHQITRNQFHKLMIANREWGDPGVYWTNNPDVGCNPCVEIAMYPFDDLGNSGWQACNLSTQNGGKIKTRKDWEKAIIAATILGTLQSTLTCFPYLGNITEKIVRKESLLGISITGIMHNPSLLLNAEIQKDMANLAKKINQDLSKKLGVNQSARLTAIKPEGCLSKDTLITTSNGILYLHEIGNINGPTWQDHNFIVSTEEGSQKSIKFYVNGKKETRKILCRSGFYIEGTLQHKIRVIDPETKIISWKSIGELSINDKVLYQLDTYKENYGSYVKLKKSTWVPSKNSRYCQEFIDPEFLDEDVAWVLGFYFGDGSNHKGHGIRVHGDARYTESLDIFASKVKKKFNLHVTKCQAQFYENDNRMSYAVNSLALYSWLEVNGLLKNKSNFILIPKLIRQSPKSVIKAFIEGYSHADGSDKTSELSFSTSSKQMAYELGCLLRSIGIDCKVREYYRSKMAFSKKPAYWVSCRQKLSEHSIKYNQYINKELALYLLKNIPNTMYDDIVNIENSIQDTYDIEVENTHNYIANGFISHNTVSCMLGTSSGIHPAHSKRFIRRVQANKLESIAQFYAKINPKAVEKSIWSASGDDIVISFACELDDEVITKDKISAIDFLEKVKSTQIHYVMEGTNKDLCSVKNIYHNVSNTVVVKNHEWDDVEKFVFDNQEYFAGISYLPYTGDKDFEQSPFSSVLTHEEIVSKYGEGALFTSGLIEEALELYNGRLWLACYDATNNSPQLKQKGNNDYEESLRQRKLQWIEKLTKFAKKYLNGNIQNTTYLLKDVYLWKTWLDLRKEVKKVDYTECIEEKNETKGTKEIACGGGTCEIL